MKKSNIEIFYPTNDDKKIYPLFSLRFILFILIFVYHCSIVINVQLKRQTAFAVSTFIILSGFLSGLLYINRDFNIRKTLEFTKKRIKRLYPLHILMLLFSSVCLLLFNPISMRQIGQFNKMFSCNLLLIHSWINNPDYYFSFNGVSWFLGTYLFLSLVTIPILLLLKKINNSKRGNLYLIIIALLLFITTILIVNCISINKLNDKFCEFWIYIFPPSRLFEYIIGIILGIICNNNKNKIKPNKSICTSLEISIILLLFVLIYGVPVIPIVNRFINYRFNMWIIPSVVMILVFSYQSGLISKLLSMRPLVFLGEISMYMFLIHQPLIELLYLLLGNIIDYKYLAIFVLIITIMLSSIINRYKNKDLVINKEKRQE